MMKNIVLADDLHQSDLKPAELLKEYISLTQGDLKSFFVDAGGLKDVSCPGCGSHERKVSFERSGLKYQECVVCSTLYVSPRPSDEAVVRFYREAPSRRFWSSKLCGATDRKRSEKIIKPRMEWVMDSFAEYAPRASRWIDLHTNQFRYVEAMAAEKGMAQKVIVTPYLDTDPARFPSGIALDPSSWWGASQAPADVLTVFELLDQTSDVPGLMSKVSALLNRGGLGFMTAILGSGFDVRELGAHADNIFPPDRMNLFSVRGLTALLERHGFELIEFSTPGVLDVDIVEKALRATPGIPVSPFIRDLVLSANEEVKAAFQAFLQANLLSSYGRVLFRKK
jgi:hypothetical protein